MIPAILAGIATKLAGLGVAAKAGIGLGIATVATAGVATVMPVVVPDTSGGTTAAAEVQLPSVPNANAGSGLSTATNATGAQAGAGARTGLDIAAQTPAAAHLPSVVPGPPASVPPATPPVNAGATGIDRARQTPAAPNLPAFVPGPPANVPPVAAPPVSVPAAGPPANVPPVVPPVNLPPAAGAGATGIDAATQSPGGQFVPPFVRGMFGRS